MQALPADGQLIACDSDARPLILARQAFEKAGVAHKVGWPSQYYWKSSESFHMLCLSEYNMLLYMVACECRQGQVAANIYHNQNFSVDWELSYSTALHVALSVSKASNQGLKNSG